MKCTTLQVICVKLHGLTTLRVFSPVPPLLSIVKYEKIPNKKSMFSKCHTALSSTETDKVKIYIETMLSIFARLSLLSFISDLV